MLAARRSNGVTIVCITRLVYRKGVDLMVEVIPGQHILRAGWRQSMWRARESARVWRESEAGSEKQRGERRGMSSGCFVRREKGPGRKVCRHAASAVREETVRAFFCLVVATCAPNM